MYCNNHQTKTPRTRTIKTTINSKHHRQRGFSFMEVMVVVVIIGLLAGAVAIKVSDYVDKARVNRAKSDIAVIVNAIETFYAEKGRYPTSEESLAALTGLKQNLLKDPWGRTYLYHQPGRNSPFEVLTYGSDGIEGGTDAQADITSDNLSVDEK